MELDTFTRDNIVNHGVNYGLQCSDKQCPKEFKEEAVAVVTEQCYTVPKVAETLNVATCMLYCCK